MTNPFSGKMSLDFVIFFLPFPQLKSLTIIKRKKWWVYTIFTIGSIASSFSVIRMGYLIKYGSAENFSWYFAPVAMWSIIEMNASVLCACLPSMAGLFQRMWSRVTKQTILSSGSGSRSRTGGTRSTIRKGSICVGLTSTSEGEGWV